MIPETFLYSTLKLKDPGYRTSRLLLTYALQTRQLAKKLQV